MCHTYETRTPTMRTCSVSYAGCSNFIPPSGLGLIELVETNKKAHIYIWPIVKIEGLLAAEIFKVTKIRKFQKNVYANLKLLNDYGLMILIRANKKAYVCVCSIFKIGDNSDACSVSQFWRWSVWRIWRNDVPFLGTILWFLTRGSLLWRFAHAFSLLSLLYILNSFTFSL